MTKKIIFTLELSPYFVPLFIMGVGILSMFGSYDSIEIKNLFVNIGWVFFLGGESYLGISIVQYFYERAQQSFTNVERNES